LRTRIQRQKGIVRPLDSADPRNPDHPSHDQQWIELAKAMGRAAADADWDRLHPKHITQNSSG